MPIQPTDIQLRLTNPLANQGNTQPQSNANLSLGGYAATTVWLGQGTLNDLFSVLTGAQNQVLTTQYRCIAVYNSHPALTWTGVTAWVANKTPGGAQAAIGLDPTAASPIGQVAAQGVVAANEFTAPPGVAFSTPTSFATGLVLGDIPPGYCRLLWIRRTAQNTEAVANDVLTLGIQGDTAA